MTLIKSISGIRGTIGSVPGNNLTPLDIIECTAAYGQWLRSQNPPQHKVIIGRDARISGPMVAALVCNTLQMMGYDVVDLGLSTTPTVEIAVPLEQAAGGIIITASHNPKQWNALKFLNQAGEFISAADGKALLDYLNKKQFEFAPVDSLGSYQNQSKYLDVHIEQILALKHVDVEAIRKKKFKVVVDCINSTASLIFPKLLQALNCTFSLIHDDLSGEFAHNPEPLPDHLSDLCAKVKAVNADLGIAVDPDVDRLALVDEKGTFIGEEYTIVTIADYLLTKTPGHTVSNMSSSDALRQVTQRLGGTHSYAMVGEVNVVREMKQTKALFGGEGNGGVIYPPLHYGRDAVVGVALVLSHLAQSGQTLSQIRASYPDLVIVKDKIPLSEDIDPDTLFKKLTSHFANYRPDTRDGVKIMFPNGWVHLRKSNTEAIIRIYAESSSHTEAQKLADSIKTLIR